MQTPVLSQTSVRPAPRRPANETAMDEQALLHNWAEQKFTHNCYRLRKPCMAEFEFIGQRGHPSSYASVRFAAAPADQTALNFDVEWPSTFDTTYRQRIENSIAEAVLDVLWSTKDAFRGCALRLVGFKWDEIGGSEIAVYRATRQALQRLVSEAEWDHLTGRYRSYDVSVTPNN
jgi:hypothetical protein